MHPSEPSGGSSASSSTLQLQTPRVFLPLLKPARYKGAHGGRGSGKSHFFAELLIEECVADPTTRAVCVREIQKSLDHSVKKLLEDKIEAMEVHYRFDILDTEIHVLDDEGRRRGIIIFQGMQNHTAESIKSLEGFDIAWVEEAQSVSQRSLDLLRPTIRKPGSELWFSWNPSQPDDPVDVLLRSERTPPGAVVVQANFSDNPWLPAELREEMEFDREADLDKFTHVWLGGYRLITDAQVLRGRCKARVFTPQPGWSGPYFGADWGFAADPTTLVKCWVDGRTLYIEAQAYKAQVDIDDTPALFAGDCPSGLVGDDGRPLWSNTHKYPGISGSREWTIRADSARPETISYMKRHGFPRCVAVEKWPGSVEDGVEHLRSYQEIVIHPDCTDAIREATAWKYKVDRRTGDVLPDLADKDDHTWDACRYALAPLIKRRKTTVKELRI